MRLSRILLLATLAALALAAPAQADPSDYAIESVAAAAADSQAGAHPDLEFTVRLGKDAEGKLPSPTRDLLFELPPGLLGNPNAVPKCTVAQLLGTDLNDPSNATGCPQASQIGIVEVELVERIGLPLKPIFEPIYNMVPAEGEPARVGFIAQLFPVMVGTRLRSESDYGVTVQSLGTPSLVSVLSARNAIWGTPADEAHDGQRITPYEAVSPPAGVPHTPSGERSANLAPVPFLSNPTRCGVAQGIAVSAVPYGLPGLLATAFAPMTPNTGCSLLDFEPEMSIAPTTAAAETGSGLGVELDFPTEGLEHPNVLAGAAQRRVEVTLPEGITANPSQAVGLGVCSEADFARERFDSAPDEGCPESSKIGTIAAKSPVLEETAEGGLFIARPYENPFDTLLALYFVIKIPERGVIVKLPAKVEPDPETGQLVTTVEEIPQLPVESFRLSFREGARAPLVTPPRCGTYRSEARFTAWSGHTVTLRPSFQIASGPGGGPCPGAAPPFEPGFAGGTTNNAAGSYSPFTMRLTRRDGDQDMTRFSSVLPAGLVAKLAGVAQCPDAAIAAAGSKSGRAEQASPSCPASSEIGGVLAGAGVGQVLTYAEGRLYLAGPYNGAPISVVAIVPAVAGPFDVGTVVTRQALRLDPRTGVVTADGASSDPIPHILAGIPLKVRDVRVAVDRPQFTLNPTSCEPMSIGATIWGGGNDVFSSHDDAPVLRAQRFQVANCANLGFKPRLVLKLKGGTKRGGHPALTGAYRPRAGDANLKGMVLRLPRSAFLDQAHIRTICTRVQFAADACPAGAIYGKATAYTPLLDKPLSGPVYLRSSDNNLPDFVADLKGIVDVEAVARIDSKNGGIRATFSEVPDAPLTKVVVQMQGAKKGLIVNSTDLCQGTHRADARLGAHNGKRLRLRPQMKAQCGGNDRKPNRHER